MRRTTTLAVALACAAGFAAPAARAEERFVVPLTTSAAGGPDAPDANLVGASRDGRVVVFATFEALLPADADEDVDVYARRGGRLELVSVPAPGASGEGSVSPRAVSEDGSTVVFEADGVFAPEDAVDGSDLYMRRNGETVLITRPESDFVLPQPPQTVRVSDDGSHVAFDTGTGYSEADTDFSGTDVYEFSGGQLRLLSGSNSFLPADVSLRDISADGTRVFMETDERLTTADTDFATDVYQRVGGQTVLMTPSTPGAIGLTTISRDGSRAYFNTDLALLPGDTDSGSRDVYARGETGPYILISTGPLAANEPVDADFQRVDDTGAHVAFTTFERLTADDLDNGDATQPAEDIYLRVNETSTELASTAAVEDRSRFDATYVVGGLSRTGGRLYWYSHQVLADDTEPADDVFVRDDGVTTRLSVGEINDASLFDASFAGASDDGTRVVFQTEAQYTTDDTDETTDLYVRSPGDTELATPAAPQPCTLPSSSQCLPTYLGLSADGARMRFSSYERLDPSDTDDALDLYESRVAAPADLGSDLPALEVDEQAAGAPVFTDLTLTEPYDDVFGATVAITAGGGAGDTLGFAGAGPVTGAVSQDGRTLTLTGRGTAADYQAALRAVTYRNADDDPQAAPRTVSVTVDNGAASDTETRQVGVRPVNDAPRLTAGGSVAYAENGGARRVAPALALSDPDTPQVTGATVSITSGFSAGQDVLDLPATPGITASYDAASGVLTLSGTAATAEYRAALREVRYRNSSDAPSDAVRTISYTATDGADAAIPVTSEVEVLPVDDPPRVALSAGSLDAATTPVALDPAATVADADSATLTRLTVRFASGRGTGDALAGGTLGPVTATPGDGSLTLTGSASPAEYQAALRTVTLALQTPGTRIVEVVAEDATGTGVPAQRAAVVAEAPVVVTPTPTPTPSPAPTDTPGPIAAPPAGPAFTRIVAPREYEARDRALRVGCEVVGRLADRCRVIVMRNGRLLGSGKVAAAPAQVLEVPIRLNRVARRLLRRPGALRVSLDARARSADGTPTVGRTFRGVLR